MRSTDHEHQMVEDHDLRGTSCLTCPIVRFATITGAAEYDPRTEKTVRVSGGKTLHSGKLRNPEPGERLTPPLASGTL